MRLISEFKEFAMRGNVVDMAVGIIIGAAFTSIVNSMVEDILMPPLGLLTGEIDFSERFIDLSGAGHTSLLAAREAGAPVLAYGSFLNAVISFVLVAFAVFLLIKGMNRLRRTQEQAPEETPVPPRPEVLLEEIRDLLKGGSQRL